MINESNLTISLADAAQAQATWAQAGVSHRAGKMHLVQTRLVDVADDLCDLIALPQRRSKTETLSAELLPLCEALRFLQRNAASILKSRKLGSRGRPLWLWGNVGRVQRVPLGRVLILAPWNYPLLLAGVQAAQALVAGNAVLLKPAPGCEAATATLIDCFQAAVGTQLIQQVSSDPSVATRIIESGVEKIVLTGSSQTGRKVLAAAVERLIPTTMELSGCDALIALPSADPNHVIEAIAFGMQFNSSATCIAPRRIFIAQHQTDQYRKRMQNRMQQIPALHVHPAARDRFVQIVEDSIVRGARIVGGAWDRQSFDRTGMSPPLMLFGAQPDWPAMSADVFAPVAAVCSYPSDRFVPEMVHASPLALAASIFGKPSDALQLANQLTVGTVTINDVIAPTADPRIPFGGRGESGFGTTRGVEGLLEMTCPRVVLRQKLRRPMHLAPPTPGDDQILGGLIELKFAGSWRQRCQGVGKLICGVRSSRRGKPD